jgi:thiosulfate dehydrogenase
MKMRISVAAVALLAACGTVLADDRPVVDLTKWVTPDPDKLPNDEHGNLVRYGRDLTVRTNEFIGPEVSNPAMRYSGTNMTCQNCHLGAGTAVYAAPLTGVSAAYPQFMPRFNATYSVADRVNACMQRSMAGTALPLDSRESKAFVAYIDFLSEGIPKGANRIGSMLKPLKEPDRPVDLANGERVFKETCSACHGEDGLGKRRGVAGDAHGYEFPPLWGADASSEGASSFRLLTVMQFVYYNMPFGVTWEKPQLTVDEAYDVAAFLVSHPKQPRKGPQLNDFPNPLDKPVDFPFGPYADHFSEAQHKYGPYGPIREEVARLKAAAAAAAKPAP